MIETYDAIVIGMGAMGASACFHLAKRKLRVLGLEQFSIPHENGSSHGQSRMIRTAYYEHPDYVPLLQRAWALWRELESESATPILHQTGGLYLGPRDCELIAGSLASSRRHGLAHELLTRDEAKRRYPPFRVPQGWVGLFEHQAGFLRPELAISAAAAMARRHGAAICENEPVVSWHSDDSGATVTTNKAAYAAGELIFCAGAWTDRLIADLGVPLTVTRQVLGWVKPRNSEPFRLGRFPVWATDNGDGTIHYGFPLAPDDLGLKVAHHAPGLKTDPIHIDRAPHPDDEQTFRPAIRRFLPDADGPLVSMQICMYTNSPDHHFIVDRHPHHRRVTFACGFSGHGFKFASVIGEALADLAMKKTSDLPIGFLGLKRFDGGRELTNG